jgi:hypothetical protein
VRRGLEALSGKVSMRYLQMARAALARAIRYAEAHDLVGRNVAMLVVRCQRIWAIAIVSELSAGFFHRN